MAKALYITKNENVVTIQIENTDMAKENYIKLFTYNKDWENIMAKIAVEYLKNGKLPERQTMKNFITVMSLIGLIIALSGIIIHSILR